ncbi:MAG TPA: DUF1800 domain-containing protein [Pyrinomonadaceae bacterium]|nr:DUF1800 domain-containing protein [Pyrinomonadaceae bacterium]
MKIRFLSCQRQQLLRLVCICAALALCGSVQSSQAAPGGPTIISNNSSTRAIAVDSVTFAAEPFNRDQGAPLSADNRTRIMIFAMNLDMISGEGVNAFSADAEAVVNGATVRYPLSVEYMSPVPGFEGITEFIVRLNDQMPTDLGDVLIRLNLHGVSSNRVRIAIGHVGGGPADDQGAVATPAPQTPPAPTPTPTPNPYTDPAFAAGGDGIRFLEQTTWGPTSADLAHVRSVGFRAYLNEQFAVAPAGSTNYPTPNLFPTDSEVGCAATDYPVAAERTMCFRDNYSMYPLQMKFFQGTMTGQDQLRQRVAYALHKILVVSGRDLDNQQSWVAPYLQVFDRNAFGNFRQILIDVTLNPGMGEYLDMRGNSRVSPNENYAREVLQLFSVGVDSLNPDGTPKLDANGNRIPTYDQATITNFARVFTGWDLSANKIWTNPKTGATAPVPNYTDPMVLSNNTGRYDTASKTLLNGQVLPAIVNGQNLAQYKTTELNAAIDNIFNNSNTGPFIAKALISQLVTSNPSPAYVQRVAATFNDNGAGVRGDMKAVITAILLDPEARGDVKTDPNYGHLREPVLYTTNLLRGFNAATDGNISNNGTRFGLLLDMGQDLFNPPTVFSYFPADYQVPGTNALFGPEYGILSTTTTFKRANFVNALVLANSGNGFAPITPPIAGNPASSDRPTGTKLDYSAYQAMAGNPAQLVDALNQLLMHGTMSQAMRDSIVTNVTNVSSANPALRTQTAIYLVATSSQYQVQR